jgi:hypothetical protein
MHRDRRFRLIVIAASLALIGLCSTASAADKSDKPPGTLSGSWKLSMAFAGGRGQGGGPRGQGGARGQGGTSPRRASGGGRGGQAGALSRQILLNLAEKDGKITGDFVGFTGKPSAIQDVKVKDGELSFKVPQQMGPNTFTLNFVAKLDGDKMQGTAKIATPAGTREFPFQGDRLKTPAVHAAGTWKLRIALKEGPTFEPTLKVTENGSAVKGVYVGDQGETSITNALIFGDELTFDVARDRGDKKYRLHFQGKIQGDALSGNADYDFDGMTGYVPFTGARVAPAQATAEKAH